MTLDFVCRLIDRKRNIIEVCYREGTSSKEVLDDLERWEYPAGIWKITEYGDESNLSTSQLDPFHPDYEGWAVSSENLSNVKAIKFDLELSLALEIAGWDADSFGGAYAWESKIPSVSKWDNEIEDLLNHLKKEWGSPYANEDTDI